MNCSPTSWICELREASFYVTDVEAVHVDAEVDEEGDAVHVAAGGRQVQRRVPEVVAPLGVAAAAHEQPQRVQVSLERRPSETTVTGCQLCP